MQPQTQHIEFQGWQRLVGRCATEPTRPAFPSTVVSGQATFEWLADQRFLIQLCHYDHPEIPDAIASSRPRAPTIVGMRTFSRTEHCGSRQ